MNKNEFFALSKLNNQKLQINDPKLAVILIQLHNLSIQSKNSMNCICTICLDDIKTPISLNCGHVFCQDCILQLKKSQPGNQKCPLCRITLLHTIAVKEQQCTQSPLDILILKQQIVQQALIQGQQQLDQFQQFQIKFSTIKKRLINKLVDIQCQKDLLVLNQPNFTQQINQLHEKQNLLQNIVNDLKPQ
ncbi:Zinc finger, C3HC4 type (RING finger) domain-containing protein [Spironucleus salmonicida]|uniref:Zinc finger, C3HC4 type (RING finger) domain-containing protein n=1 Tax=Spironucleus salmonicida TaxID=348837 RepID=V6LHA6_9EUKA|nr:Zinc finger, C3HC4 type (RING finger) domain-containing protein [Spironucleus salmonicida]|eukprot:EST43927.1 Zinc finger, C3HC4 type (RING finger) domain-containing protein [Spironucleus salmonicida]